MPERRALGEVIREARSRAGLTQAELSRRAGMHPNHVLRLEEGDKSFPRFDSVARLAAVLGLSLDEIATRCGYDMSHALPANSGQSAVKALQALRRAALASSEAGKALEAAVADLTKIAPGNPRKRRGA